MNNNQV